MKPLLLLLFIFSLSSCAFFGKKKDFPEGNYQMILGYSNEEYHKVKRESPQNVEADAYGNDPMLYRSFLSLQDKDKFVMAIDDILLFGKYRFNGDRLELNDEKKGSLALDIVKVKGDFVQLRGDFSQFSSAHVPTSERLYINFALDKTPIRETPSKFDSQVNLWRNAPVKSESEKEIKTRTLNFVDYSIAYFQHISSSGTHHDYRLDGVESPIIYAENGIVLKKWEDVPESWKELFYNEQNALVAYQYLFDGFKYGSKEEYHVTGLLLITFYLKNLRNSLATNL
ncbi:hypothetical protein ACLCDV_24165 [Sphingobacterium sp. Lzh-3]|uniref:hypothetical protein n=1 Tax=unclassified Sphingobacterium TaxID=2609468 RepID=UPI002955375E|nr:hypothetical protein [Sphingobacterium sp. UGAL515B_05]WON96641.1 hypothetical protein OK025_09580 [Sphingobacterium sp. UGAL515B_05]